MAKKVNKDSYKSQSFYRFSKDHPAGKSPNRDVNRKENIRKFISGVKVFICFALLFTFVYFGVTLMLDVSNLPIAEETPSAPTGNTGDAPQTTEPPRPQKEEIRGVYITDSSFSSPESAKAFAEKAVQNGINTAVIDLKKETGMLSFHSSSPVAEEIGSNGKNGDDLKNILSALREGGLKVTAAVNCFNDPLMAGKKPEAAVHYNNTDMLWLDNRRENGGKPWLNPYSEEARGYLIDIIKEIAAMPVDKIMLKGVQFPSGFSLDLASYEGEETGGTRNEALVSFIEEAASAANKGEIIVSMTGDGAINGNPDIYDGNLLDSGISLAAPDMRLSKMRNVKLGDKNYYRPSDKAEEFMPSAAAALSQRAKVGGREVALCPIIEAASLKDAQNAINIFKSNNITDYIIYSPSGTYNFS